MVYTLPKIWWMDTKNDGLDIQWSLCRYECSILLFLPHQSCWGRMLWRNDPWSSVDGLENVQLQRKWLVWYVKFRGCNCCLGEWNDSYRGNTRVSNRIPKNQTRNPWAFLLLFFFWIPPPQKMLLRWMRNPALNRSMNIYEALFKKCYILPINW